MDDVSRLALALGIGLLIGLERGWHTRDARPGSRAAGMRTFAIAGLLGGIVGSIARAGGEGLTVAGSLLIAGTFAAYSAVIALFGREENRAAGAYSATTTVAALLTFMLGVYATAGNPRLAAGAAVAAAGILVVREKLHEWLRRITPAEIQSVLVLLAMSFIALPIMPDRFVGPLGGINPRQVWLIAITLAGVSFAGFVAVKSFGERQGVLLGSAIGGTVSSTAVMYANAQMAVADSKRAAVLAAGSALATAVSFVRVVAIVAVLAPALLRDVAPSLLAGALAAAAFAFIVSRARSAAAGTASETRMRNPFGFLSVVSMALVMGSMMLALRAINGQFGAAGIATGAAIAGLLDVDAMTVSITQLVPEHMMGLDAAHAILGGVVSNTLAKNVLGAVIGRGRFALAVTLLSLVCILSGAVALFLTGLWMR